jgi:hypothetical protein
VASLAVLADDDPTWRPSEFRRELFGCESGFRFPTVKLLDFAAKEAELEASDNLFSKVVLAHLKALETRKDESRRHVWKVRLIRSLYERGLGPKDVRELFRVIDWLMELPEPFATLFWEDVEVTQKEKRMPFVSTPERVGEQRGLRKGIEALLRVRFGSEGLKLMPEIEKVYGEEKLRAVLAAAETAVRLEDVRSIWTAEAEPKT